MCIFLSSIFCCYMAPSGQVAGLDLLDFRSPGEQRCQSAYGITRDRGTRWCHLSAIASHTPHCLVVEKGINRNISLPPKPYLNVVHRG